MGNGHYQLNKDGKMVRTTQSRLGMLLMATSLLAAPAAIAAQQAAPLVVASAVDAVPDADRRAILAMAGTYKVKFDFREKVPFIAGYMPLAPKESGGREVVRIIEDSGDRISLQHILVASDPTKPNELPMVIKHWRQDWVWQPKSVLTYRGDSTWALDPVAQADARGTWSQTVWQTDDSPRYGGIGRWTFDNGVASWISSPTLRPLARRDAVRHPVYDRYIGINRHALTPTGWVHEQENAKLGLKDGKRVTYVDETVVNTYDRFDDFKIAAADDYWKKTAAYWADVRKAWDASLAGGKPLVVTEVAEAGSVTGERLMGWADEIAAGKLADSEATRQATTLIGGLAKDGPAKPTLASNTH